MYMKEELRPKTKNLVKFNSLLALIGEAWLFLYFDLN